MGTALKERELDISKVVGLRIILTRAWLQAWKHSTNYLRQVKKPILQHFGGMKFVPYPRIISARIRSLMFPFPLHFWEKSEYTRLKIEVFKKKIRSRTRRGSGVIFRHAFALSLYSRVTPGLGNGEAVGVLTLHGSVVSGMRTELQRPKFQLTI